MLMVIGGILGWFLTEIVVFVTFTAIWWRAQRKKSK